MIDEIEDQIRTGFSVTNIPKGILKKFKHMCKEEFGDIYWVGISELLKIKQRYEEMSILLSSLQKQIDNLNKKMEVNNVKTTRTFG
jgi:hypothetical protein